MSRFRNESKSKERGQATTEYVLLLAVAVGFFLMVKSILGPVLVRLGQNVTLGIQNKLFGADLHHFRVR